MNLDILAVLLLGLALPIALDIAAVRWGVDSRFHDIRSDFV